MSGSEVTFFLLFFCAILDYELGDHVRDLVFLGELHHGAVLVEVDQVKGERGGELLISLTAADRVLFFVQVLIENPEAGC